MGYGYSRAVIESFDHPYHAGCPEGSGQAVSVGRAGSAKAGALIEVSLKIAQDRVAEAGFRAFGCPHTIAAASRLTARLEGQSVVALEGLDTRDLAAELEVPAEKLGRLLILADALAAALADWRRRQRLTSG